MTDLLDVIDRRMGSFMALYLRCWCTGLPRYILYLTTVRSPGPWHHKINAIWWSRLGNDQGLQGDIDFKVTFSKADILQHSFKVKITNLFVDDLVQDRYVDVTNTMIISDPEWSVLYTSCLVKSMFSLLCTARMRDILTMVIWALIYQDLRICYVTPGFCLSMRSADMTQWLRISGLARWKSSI